MAHVEMLGHQTVLRHHDVVVTIVRKLGAQAITRLRRSAASDAVRHDDEIFRRIERLAGAEQLVAERGPQPVGPAAAGPVQQDYAVDDFARRIALFRSERPVVQLELREYFATGKDEVLDDEV